MNMDAGKVWAPDPFNTTPNTRHHVPDPSFCQDYIVLLWRLAIVTRRV